MATISPVAKRLLAIQPYLLFEETANDWSAQAQCVKLKGVLADKWSKKSLGATAVEMGGAGMYLAKSLERVSYEYSRHLSIVLSNLAFFLVGCYVLVVVSGWGLHSGCGCYGGTPCITAGF
jgi:predicted small integral membrane protein